MLHIGCMNGTGTLIKDEIQRWVNSDKENLCVGDYVKVVESVTIKTSIGQVNIIIRMKSHRRRFQGSIGMVEWQGIHNSNGNVYGVPGKYMIRKLILNQKMYEGKQSFLSVTKIGVQIPGKLTLH